MFRHICEICWHKWKLTTQAVEFFLTFLLTFLLISLNKIAVHDVLRVQRNALSLYWIYLDSIV